MQRHRYRGKFPMDAPAIANVITVQCHRFYANISMHVCVMVNVKMMQLGTSCSFDSPGLARNEPTLGYACSEEINAVGVVRFLRGMP